MYRTAPHRTAPHRTAPHRTAPHRTAPHRTAPHRTAPHRTAPHRTAPHRTAPHRTAPHCTGRYCSALHYSVLQRIAMHCNTLHCCIALWWCHVLCYIILPSKEHCVDPIMSHPESRRPPCIYSLVISRIDYANCLLYDLPQCLISMLQRVQNAAARLVFLPNC